MIELTAAVVVVCVAALLGYRWHLDAKSAQRQFDASERAKDRSLEVEKSLRAVAQSQDAASKLIADVAGLDARLKRIESARLASPTLPLTI